MRKTIAGMTFIELIIALAIMAILLTIAYPLYEQQAQRARRADAQTALQMIALAEERYYTSHGAYTTDLGILDLHAKLQNGTSEYAYYTLTISNNDNPQTFSASATAIGSQTSDTDCQVFRLNQLGVKSALDSSDVANTDCW